MITGAGSGIRRATALLFAREGAAVADIADDAGRETVSLIEQAGGRGIFVHADVAVVSQAGDMVDSVVHQFGRLDILHNNAYWTVYRAAVETTEAEWDRTLAVCLKGPFLAAKTPFPTCCETTVASSSIRLR